MNNAEYRHEEKYLISRGEYEYLSRLLSAALKRDSHSLKKGEYFIRSLYFDTLDNRAYEEKMGGILERMKIRLRIYDTDAGSAKLEIKNKSGAGVLKESVTVSRLTAKEMARSRYEEILAVQHPTAQKVYRYFKTDSYRPVVLIDYEREAYVMPVFQVRITFDKNLRARLGAGAFFERTAPMYQVMRGDQMILEVKYNHMLPQYVKAMLGSAAKQAMPMSKYCMSRSLVG